MQKLTGVTFYSYYSSWFICDQICQKGSYTRTVSGLTRPFDRYNNRPIVHACTIAKTQRSAFTEASFTGLSGVQWCSGGL